MTIKEAHAIAFKCRQRHGLDVCYLCDQTISVWDLSDDHVVPKSQGGTRHPTNILRAHKACNEKRGDRVVFSDLLTRRVLVLDPDGGPPSFVLSVPHALSHRRKRFRSYHLGELREASAVMFQITRAAWNRAWRPR